MPITQKRNTYKPFDYPWAYNYFKTQNRIHWIPDEVPMSGDVTDWKHKLTSQEKNLVTQILRFFTQGDIDIAEGYYEKYIPTLGKTPEIRMMLGAFAAMEGIHIDAYSHLLTTLGFEDKEYAAFTQYKAMADKHDFFSLQNPESVEDIARTLAIYSAFGEGLQLFSSFVILLNFPRHGKLRGMGQIVSWSVRDESLHIEGMIRLFKQLIEENPKIVTPAFKKSIYDACRTMVELEDAFIDLAFEQGGITGLTPEEVKTYIRYIADRRLISFGLKGHYKVKDNPLPWVEEMINGVEHTNFFENRATEYSKGSLTGSWGEVFPG